MGWGEGQGWGEWRGSTGTSLNKVWRLWNGLSMQQGWEQAVWPLLFSPPAALMLPRAQTLLVPNHKPHPAAVTARGDNENSFQYLEASAVMRISPHTTPKPTCKAGFPRGKKMMFKLPPTAHIPSRIPPAASQPLQVSLAHLPSQLGRAPQKAEAATAPLSQPLL